MGTIQVTDLGKAYRQYPSRRSRMFEWFSFSGKPRHTLKWILQGITFTVPPGEAVGIIGINGAGKSTLLKLLTGTTQPTTGTIHLTGRVAALLELGMGFHADFTGRQNVFMAGQLLGYSVAELEQLMPEIESFAEIGEYIDQPIRVYSSGMQMRLAFSVATARRPDILIVDEALSVGDAYFQHKSFDRIRQFRKAGTTLLLVSHEKSVIQSICDRALLLAAGKIAMQGDPQTVMDYYNAMLAEGQSATVRQNGAASGAVQTISGSGEATVVAVELLSEEGQQLENVHVGQTVRLRIRIRAETDLPELVLGYMIKDRLGQPVFGTNTYHLRQPLLNVAKGTTAMYNFKFAANLGCGSYSVAVALHTEDSHIARNYEWRDMAMVFTVTNPDKDMFVGVAWLPPELAIRRDES